MLPLVFVGGRGVLGPRRVGETCLVGTVPEVVEQARAIEATEHPRWLVAAASSSLRPLVEAGVRVQRCWDVAEAHRLLHGGWAAGLPLAWAHAHGLDPGQAPRPAGHDLFDLLAAEESTRAPDDPDAALRGDGYLRPDVLDPAWATTPRRLRAVAEALLVLAARQHDQLTELGPRSVPAAHSESAAAVLCLELERDGLPVDRQVAEEIIGRAAGPRPRDDAEATAIRRTRDTVVLRHAPGREQTDLRNPTQVRDLLGAVGVTVPSTRKGFLEPFRATQPLVAALLDWRKDERIATTYGYRWLDEHVGPDGRLRGGWSACDGAAGRMTAQNGLHNLPGPLRPAVVAAPGFVLVRADLGQIEPRVLAVVSGDRSLAEATTADDLYAPVATRLGVERPVAKVAVLAAMYGQRSGAAGRALGGLERAYPVAMRLLDDAYAAGVARQPLRTYGGRRINLDTVLVGGDDAARGRFARNAIIQGSAAELFKAWAATVRHAVTPLGAQIVLCLHDELLVHAPHDHAADVADLMGRTLDASARRWAGTDQVRFVADTGVIVRWSDAKG